jgi:Sulfotransferase family
MRLILIGGAQRSGTTLLQTLLANALESPILPEAHILTDILAAYKRAKEFGNKTCFFYPTDDALRSFFQPFAQRHVADIVASAKPVGVLVLKDPNFVQVLDEASALFPQSLQIFCMRDPRDIAASFVQIGQRQTSTAQSAIKPSKYEKRDIGFISKKILTSYLPLMQTTQPLSAAIVRYEDMASDPKGSLTALARETGLKLSLDRIEHPVWLHTQARHDASWVTELEGGKPSPDSIGSFTRVLRGDEIAIIQTICEPIMSRFGYTPIEDQALRRDRVLKRLGLRRTRSWST